MASIVALELGYPSFGTVISLCTRLLISYLVFVVTQTIYDVYFGPLSHIPGPKLAASTRFVIFYHKIVTGRAESWITNLHEKYGPVVRTAPTEISFTDSNARKIIYGHAPGSKFANLQKDTRFYRTWSEDRSLNVANEADAARQRKSISHAFSEKAIVQQLPMLTSYVEQLLDNIRKAADSASKIDLVKNYNFMTFDIMGDLTFGEPLGCLQSSEYTPWIGMIFSSLKLMQLDIELVHFPLLYKLLQAITPASAHEEFKAHQKNSNDRVDKRLAAETSRPDIFGLIIDANSKGEQQRMRVGEMRANADLFMIAGTETSATVLSGLTYFLLKNPEKLQRLKQELFSTFPSLDDELDLATLARLPYLNACIEEGLRIYPPAPIGMPRLTPKGGIEISGYRLPENVAVFSHHLASSTSPDNFTRPQSFLPERWLKDQPAEFANDDLAAAKPFSLGPRSCPGTNLAYAEMRLTLAKVIRKFDLTLCPESDNWIDQPVYLLWSKGPLMVNVTPSKQ